MLEPHNVAAAPTGKPIKMVQLSESPRVFQIHNFIAEDEIAAILKKNKRRMTPSEVGFAGWQDDTRTSSTAWDMGSKTARKLQKRSFDLLGMDYEPALADALQVLNYKPGQWYKPHTDYFDAKVSCECLKSSCIHLV